jgi:hypothetical protein
VFRAILPLGPTVANILEPWAKYGHLLRKGN